MTEAQGGQRYETPRILIQRDAEQSDALDPYQHRSAFFPSTKAAGE